MEHAAVNADLACRRCSHLPRRLAAVLACMWLLAELGLVPLPPMERHTYVWIFDHSLIWWIGAAVLYYACNRIPGTPRARFRPASASSADYLFESKLRGAIELGFGANLATFGIAAVLIAIAAVAVQPISDQRDRLLIIVVLATLAAGFLHVPRYRRVRITERGVFIISRFSRVFISTAEIASVDCAAALSLRLRNSETVRLARLRQRWHPLYDSTEQLHVHALYRAIAAVLAQRGPEP